jgi:chemotaxis protein methyltransferase CheR
MIEAPLPPIGKTISDQDFHRFREFFYRRTGIFFEDSKRYFVDKRLIERVEATSMETFRSYFSFLRFQASGEEIQLLTNAMTVNETYFLREEYQFRCLVESILPEIARAKSNTTPIRIWCVPSSSGEEPYSIAMYLLERWPGIHKWDVEILSSDIDTAILAAARKGLYSARSVQHLPPQWLLKYFRSVGDAYRINDEIREAVHFTQVNLTEPLETAQYRAFDVIFCRNLLIYFDDVSRKVATDALFQSLNPGGYLCLGHSESISRMSSLFKVCKFPEAIVYRKTLEGR